MFFKSIRFKVLLSYMLLLTLTLLGFSMLLYGAFNKILVNNLDDLLSARAEGVENAIHTYEHAKEASVNMPFQDMAKDWLLEKRKDPELMNVFIRILDAKGERVAASKAMPFIAPLDKDALDDAISGEDDFDTVNGSLIDGKKSRFRVYTKPIILDGKIGYIIQVAAPIEMLSIAMYHLRLVLFIILPLTILLAGIPGVLLAGLTLKPVTSMIDTLRQITAENLKLKIHLPDTKDEIKRLADTFNDMIERLDRSFSSQQNFIQDISYELKEPLVVLKDELNGALEKPQTKEEYESLMRKGLAETEKFSTTIDDLLALAKFDNSQMPLEIKRFDLTKMLKKLLVKFKKSCQEKDIILSSFLQNVVTLDGDEGQLKKMFENIFDNALKYTYRKGKITVSVHKNKKNAVVTISDTGIGMPEDELLYIFDRFYQINRSGNGRRGFGLGLSIAKSIAESHKGKITAESQAGKGSTFTVTLPLSYPG